MNIFLIFSIIIFAIMAVLFTVTAVKYNLFKTLFLVLTKNIGDLDRHRRTQIRKSIKKKHSEGYENFCRTLKKMGFNSMVPWFNPITLLIYRILICLFVGCLSASFYDFKIAFVLFVATSIVIFESGIITSKIRRAKAESQIVDLVKKSVFASVQYTKITDIFCNIYTDFDGVLRDAMHDCYIEEITNKDMKTAIKHFSERFFSPLIDTAVNNMVYCKEDGLDLNTVSQTILDTITPYAEECIQRRGFVASARREVIKSVSAFIVIVVAGIIALNWGNGLSNMYQIIKTLPFIPLILIVFFTFIYGINLER